MKTLAVRLNESTRAQLDIVAHLNDHTGTDEIRLALEAWMERTKCDSSVLQRTESVRAEIEREAATKRDAIAAIFAAAREGPRAPRRPLPVRPPRADIAQQLSGSGGAHEERSGAESLHQAHCPRASRVWRYDVVWLRASLSMKSSLALSLRPKTD